MFSIIITPTPLCTSTRLHRRECRPPGYALHDTIHPTNGADERAPAGEQATGWSGCSMPPIRWRSGRVTVHQGWAQDLLGRDRDQDRDLSSRDQDETETFAKLSETRPRRDPRVSETRSRRDLFLVETISRHMAYKCMVYALHTVSQKKNPLD